MALIAFGASRCPICGRVIDGPPVFATSGVFLPPDDPLWEFCDAGMHWDCYEGWEHRPRFARAYVDSWVEHEPLNPYWGRGYLDDLAYVSANPDPHVSTASVLLYATASDIRVPLSEWEAWLAGGWKSDPDLHDVERAALAEVVPRLRDALPTAGSVTAGVDWASKAATAEWAKEEYAERERERLRTVAAANERVRWMELRRKHKGLTCPQCGRQSKEFRLMDGGSDRVSYFVCPACGRSFGPEDEKA